MPGFCTAQRQSTTGVSWAFHYHNLYHMMTGLMTEVRYSSII